MKEAIRKAIEGGYTVNGHPLRWEPKTKSWWYYWMSEDGEGNPVELSNPACLEHPHYFWEMVSKPLFWQSLGKAMGWGNSLWIGEMKQLVGDKIETHKWECRQSEYHWHRFIDHIASGKDAESFFQDLLANVEKR